MDELVHLRWPDGVVCPGCGSPDVADRRSLERRTGERGAVHQRRGWRCRSCRKDFALTSGTWLHRSHTPIEMWEEFAALVAGQDVSAAEVAEWCGVRYEAALRMMKLCAEVFDVSMENEFDPEEPYVLSLPGLSRAEILGRMLQVRL